MKVSSAPSTCNNERYDSEINNQFFVHDFPLRTAPHTPTDFEADLLGFLAQAAISQYLPRPPSICPDLRPQRA